MTDPYTPAQVQTHGPSCSQVQHQHRSNHSATTIISSDCNAASDPPMLHPEEDDFDRRHLEKIIAALRFYRKYSYVRVNKSESYLNSLPQNHQNMLTKYRKHLNNIRDCIDENQAVIKKMIRDRENIFVPYSSDALATQTSDADGLAVKIRHQDMENQTILPETQPEHVVEPFKLLKVHSTLKQFARDWSVECVEEREQSYKPIIDVIEEYFNPKELELNEIKILVPGAGLGRLTYELACRGYECEGNEYSYFMLIASNFVLNECTEENQYTLYPWVHQYVNNLNRSDQAAAIRFPDVCPMKHPPKGNIMMSAGDFLLVYKIPNAYNCVATCFFIDCANNVVEFIETIYRILVPGGIWVNLGPLLYHFSDIQGENSIEPTHEDIMEIIEAVGFHVIRSETGRRTKYAQNPRSMLKSEYESLFWVCQKPDGMHQQQQQNNDDEATQATVMPTTIAIVNHVYSNGYKESIDHCINSE